jgi:methyl-accepting chemotaxis protein
MASTVHEVARNTSTAAESAQQANDAAKNGHVTTERAVSDINGLVTRIEETAVVINRLNEDAAHVSTVLEVIRGIAEQTNLLALNAAIEAARAGEQGRGFAVVADEVRTLAGKTQQSTEEIRDIIEKLQAGSLTAVEAMNAAQTSGQQGAEQVHHVASELTNIRSLVQQINDMNTQIASAVEEQSAVATEINNNITSLNHIGEESAGSAAASAQSSMDLAELAQNLNRLAGMFKV